MARKPKLQATITAIMGDGSMGRQVRCDGIRDAKQTFRRMLETAGRFGGCHITAKDDQGNDITSQLY